jgi:hypothetical protein
MNTNVTDIRKGMILKLAVLIDADNIPYSNIKGMLDEKQKWYLQPSKESMETGQNPRFRLENLL